MSCTNISQAYDAETLFSVGRRLLNGNCVEKDTQRAKQLLGQAAEMGHRGAIELLNRLQAEEPAETKQDMTEWNKMRSAQLYDWTDSVIDRSQKQAKITCARFNQTTIDDTDYRPALEAMIPGIPATSAIQPPFHCDHGNGIHLGENVFINYNGMFLDAGDITIGSHTLIGPNCSLYTPQHPMDYLRRRQTKATAYPITIGEDCWLGGNVTVCPGVVIGDRTIIGAGSVVTHDIPSDCVAAGNPCEVIRSVNESSNK